MEEITLNLIPTGVRPTCHVSQNDNERDIKINLVEGSLAYAIKSGDIVKLNIKKPNDVVISSRITATVGNTYVIANIKDEMCNVDGTNLCEIRITNGGTRISTSNFLMEVEIDPSANGGGGGGGASNLADLDDVNISEPSDGQVLKYNGTSEMWENGTGGGGGASAMSDLTDVDLTGLEDGNSLVYDDEDDVWKVQTITKEVTQAEYDALVQAGTVDPKTAYFIKDTNGDGQDFYPVVYSLEERVIGVWKDGKPLYQKTLEYNFTSASTWSSPALNLDIDTIADFYAYVKLGSEGASQWITSPYIERTSYKCDCHYQSADDKIYVKSDWEATDAIVTIRYTKTTDTAGSGTWTPQGVPAIHYSSNEHVIGTWLDGSTLYEKTIYYAGGSSGTITIPHNISNMGKCVDAFGTCHDQGYGSQHDGEGDMPLPRIATDGYNVGIAGVNVTNIVLGIASIWGSRIIDFYITLRYTKS